MPFRTMASTDGLHSVSTWCLAQDDLGLVWVGTEDGLYLYDGQRFHAYGMAQGLLSSRVDSLLVLPGGGLLVGTFAGLCRLPGLQSRRLLPVEGLPQVRVRSLAWGPAGEILAATPSGLFQGPPSGPLKPSPAWPGGEATAVWGQVESGVFLAAEWKEGHSRVYRLRDGKAEILEGPPSMGTLRVEALCMDAQQCLWARTREGLYQAPRGQSRFTLCPTPIPPARQAAFLHLDREGHLWVPSEAGLHEWDGKVWSHLGADRGIPDTPIRTLLMDRESTLWLGSVGLLKLRGGWVWRAYTAALGLPNTMVWSVFRDRGGKLWAGTETGLASLGPRRFTPIKGSEGVQVRSIAEDALGRLYFGGLERLQCWERGSGRVLVLGREAGLQDVGRIFTVRVDRSGAVWLATERQGLLRSEPGVPTRLHFQRVILPGQPGPERVTAIQEDGEGRILVTGLRGIWVLEPDPPSGPEKRTASTPSPFASDRWRLIDPSQGLRAAHVSYLIPTRNGEIVFAYFDALGIGRGRIEGGRITALEHLDAAFPAEKVYALGESSDGSLWVGSTQGVRLLTSEGSVDHFSEADGLAGNDISSQCILADPSGDVWIGSHSGLARFVRARYWGSAAPPPPLFLGLRMGGEALPLEPKGGTTPPMAFTRGNLELDFASPSYTHQGLQYEARLEGLEADFHPTQGLEARYPALPPGSYTFQVRARKPWGPWSATAQVALRVLPPWYQTWWFRILEGVMAGGVVLAIVRWRVGVYRRRNQELEALVEARTQELGKSAEALRAQSLTDHLTGLRNRRYLDACMPEEVARVRRIRLGVLGGDSERAKVNTDILLVMVDLDHFKTVNDTHGHHAGDLVLQQMACILNEVVRDTDSVVRWGGEEFLIVARNACRADARVLVERIRTQVEDHPFHIDGGQTLNLSCSVGFNIFPLLPNGREILNWEQAVDLADRCLYLAKRSGRNGWVGVVPEDSRLEVSLVPGTEIHVDDLLNRGLVSLVTSFREVSRL